MNKLFINGRFLTQPLSGMQRFAEELLSALDKLLDFRKDILPRFHEIEVLVPKGGRREPKWKNIRIKEVGNLSGHFWEQIDLYRRSKYGLLINLTSSGPLLHRNSVLVMHDAAIFAHPEHFSRNYRLWHTFLRPRLARRATRLATISAFSTRELSKYCGVLESSFAVIGDSAEHMLEIESDTQVLDKFGLIKNKYALTVGNQSPNKNIGLAIQAFQLAEISDWSIAVVGGGDSIFGDTNKIYSANLKRLGRVSDGELRALYENAAVFLFPSRYEGFGVPPLEAFSLGCPVISSDSSAMPEVLGSAAVFFRSDDVNDFSIKIRDFYDGKYNRNSLVEVGHMRVNDYSWAKSANTLVEVINECALGGS